MKFFHQTASPTREVPTRMLCLCVAVGRCSQTLQQPHLECAYGPYHANGPAEPLQWVGSTWTVCNGAADTVILDNLLLLLLQSILPALLCAHFHFCSPNATFSIHILLPGIEDLARGQLCTAHGYGK